MKLKLKKEKWLDKLSSIREAGMGYQFVDITLKDGRIMRKAVVYNSETIELRPRYESVSEDDIAQIEEAR
ncbi:hypothetical protein MYX07_07165 [Patescibacteria group bacterium AH-259-L07]|nr:hypothetical protein [Patescibacteria group bacterium AH-259-L07]